MKPRSSGQVRGTDLNAAPRQAGPVRSVLVASLGAPEINHLSVELERRGVLTCYVRPYVNKRRRWERLVEAAPGIGGLYARTLGRRVPPFGVKARDVIEAGVWQDFAGAALSRLGWHNRMYFATERAVARKAGGLAQNAEVVIASYGTARYAFESIRRVGGRAILSYPIAHNAFQARLYAEEAELAPEYAAALPRLDSLPPDYTERLGIECELADRILVGSSFVRHSFVTMGFDARRFVVAPYGVDTLRFAPRTRPRRDGIFRVLFVGQIGQRKGLSYLFQAYERFRRHDSELHLVGSYVPGSEVYARHAALYRYTPNVPNNQLPAVFHDADAFVFPSLIEGMPLVVLEAMASGLPVIATEHGSADVLRDGIDGFLVPIRDAQAIADRLERLYRDPELREHMGRNAREQALRHTWSQSSQRACDAVLN
jgi:glycosyltransferase involved in cell wall biosynthesis